MTDTPLPIGIDDFEKIITNKMAGEEKSLLLNLSS